MANNHMKELFGTEFSVVPEGLSEEEVVSFVDSLKARSQDDGSDEKRQSSLIQLAEKTVIEAHGLAEGIKEQAVRDAKAESARIGKLAEEKAQEQAQRIWEAAQEEANANAGAIVAKAEQEAQQLMRKARRGAQDVLQAARQRAEEMEAEAKLEAEFTVRKLTARVTEEIGTAVANISNNLLPALDDPEEGSAQRHGQSRKRSQASGRARGRASAKR